MKHVRVGAACINAQCRSMQIYTNSICIIDSNININKLSIKPHFGPVPEFCSVLIDIHRHWASKL